MNRCGIFIVVWGLLGFPLHSAATETKIDATSKTFILHLGATRVIYNPSGNGSTLSVYNNQDYPMLVQSEVLAEDRKGKAPFVVTPPLFDWMVFSQVASGLFVREVFSLKIVKVYSGFVLRVFLQKVVIDGLMIKTGIKLMTEYPCK